jgi:hypothetical protein
MNPSAMTVNYCVPTQSGVIVCPLLKIRHSGLENFDGYSLFDILNHSNNLFHRL